MSNRNYFAFRSSMTPKTKQAARTARRFREGRPLPNERAAYERWKLVHG